MSYYVVVLHIYGMDIMIIDVDSTQMVNNHADEWLRLHQLSGRTNYFVQMDASCENRIKRYFINHVNDDVCYKRLNLKLIYP